MTVETTKSLTIQDQREYLLSLVANGKSAATQTAYRRSILSYIAWSKATNAGFSRAALKTYVQFLLDEDYAPATINLKLTALRQLANELRFDGVIDNNTAEGILNVQGVEKAGRRLGHWLTSEQVQDLVSVPDLTRTKGLQEYLVLALLLGCALRRSEAAKVWVQQIVQLGDLWVLKDITGKKNRTRSVPLSDWVEDAIVRWQSHTGVLAGPLLRPTNRGGWISNNSSSGKGMTGQAIYYIVKKLAKQIDLPELGPHSLRRTWARTAYKQGYPLDQIKYILGHASILTTEIYLGLKDLDTENPVLVDF
jgi:site-specific recombinase XerD